jgi:hypothetical protein
MVETGVLVTFERQGRYASELCLLPCLEYGISSTDGVIISRTELYGGVE